MADLTTAPIRSAIRSGLAATLVIQRQTEQGVANDETVNSINSDNIDNVRC